MVGFNRRFAPHIVKARQLLESIAEPKCLVVTVNAGAIPLEHWTQDRDAGGGRLIGEGCHFGDLLRFLVGAPITDYEVRWIGKPVSGTSSDKFTLTSAFQDGSIGTLHYFASERPQELFKRAPGNLLCESGAPTRKLSQDDRLRMVRLSQDEPVAVG